MKFITLYIENFVD